MAPSADEVKGLAVALGADLCGIASADAFTGTPPGHHPRDLLAVCRSVIVVGRRFPAASMSGGPDRYTRARDRMAVVVNRLSGRLAERLREAGTAAFVQKSMETGRWEEDGRYRDALSLKHAAVLAGLGKIGRNYLLINRAFGNMLWFGAVLTDLGLAPDPPADYDPCPPRCRVCANVCPVGAVVDGEIDQRKCFGHAYSYPGGRELISCWTCRQACPRHAGIRRRGGA